MTMLTGFLAKIAEACAKIALLAVVGLALLAALVTGASAQGNALFVPIPANSDTATRTDQLASLAQNPTTMSLQLARINADAFQGATMLLALPGIGDVVVENGRKIERSPGDFTWIGEFPNGGNAILVVQDGEVTGQIQSGLDSFRVIPVGGGAHAIVRLDPGKFPTDHPPSIRLQLNDNNAAQSPLDEARDPVRVDILVAYTTASRIAYGGNMAAFAQLAVDASNVAYTNSNANVSLRLVGTQEITYSEAGKTFDIVLDDLLAGTNPQMAAVHTKRDQVGADLVGLMINLTDFCGLASSISATAANAYMAVYYDCSVSNHSFAHELGHLFGARHDPFVDSTTTPFPYGHGYISPGNTWRTVMAYVNGCGSCPRLQYFSNPSVTYGGVPMGTVSTHDNARVHRERVSTVAGFRSTVGSGASSASHDFNADGKSDILWLDTAGNVAMWLMNGQNVIGANAFGNVGPTWKVVGQRDFNGDGKHDILWRDSVGNLGLWQMNGAAVSSAQLVSTISLAWTVVGTPDLNGDKKSDIFWRDGAGNLAVWFMNGSSIVSAQIISNISLAWTVIGTPDLNGDGYSDILWRDGAGNLAVWFMSGAAIQSASIIGNIPLVWSVIGTGDFNGDGKGDLLWRDGVGNVAIWLMNGTTITTAAVIGNVPAASTWAVAQTGDYNGDGNSDILWRDGAGNIGMWFMNGIAGSAILVGNLSTNWVAQGLNAD
jgi:hypothetical protein